MPIVVSYPRIHVGLFDLAGSTPRKYGGAGFAVAGLPAIVEAVPASSMELQHSEGLDSSTRSDLLSALERLKRRFPRLSMAIRFLRVPPQHVGLGSKTSIILGTLKAIDLAGHLSLSARDLQLLSGRGGTSGIGINSFFVGGFIIDDGHDTHLSKGFLPSRARRRFEIPSITHRQDIPENWVFHLLLSQGESLHGGREIRFFQENTPIGRNEAFQTVALAFHGLVPAVRAGNLKLLSETLTHLHSFGFKHRELGAQSRAVRALFAQLCKREDCAVGLSSMGPLLYVVSLADNKRLALFLRSLTKRFGVKLICSPSGRNQGFEIQ